MRLDQLYRSAIKVCDRLGTWVLYAVRDARNLDHLIGYMAYTVDDLEGMKARSESADRQAHLSKLIGYWRRAIRWVSALDRVHYAVLAERLLEMMAQHPEHRSLPYVVKNSGHRSLSAHDQPPRRSGRPRTRAGIAATMKPCWACNGLGFAKDGG